MSDSISQVVDRAHTPDPRRPDVKPQTYGLAETAKLFGCGYTAFREHMLRGELPVRPFRIGNRWLFRRVEVDRALGIAPAEDAGV